MKKVYVARMDSPVGPLFLAAAEEGLIYLGYDSAEGVPPEWLTWLNRYVPDSILEERDSAWLSEAKEQLEKYFQGKLKRFDLNLVLHGTPFQTKVWRALQTIDYNETCSYKHIAEKIGNPGAVRAVGGANNRNPVSIIVPCHRIIGANGSLVGYGGGLHIKKRLLSLEAEVGS